MGEFSKQQISILTDGTRGDVQPYLALGVGLQQVGYTVKLAAPARFEDWIRSYGIEFAPISNNPQKIIDHPEFQQYKDNLFSSLLGLPKLIGSVFTKMMDNMWKETQGADVILMTPVFYGAYSSAEKLGIPVLLSSPFPVHPTREFPGWGLRSQLSLGETYNRYSQITFEIFINLLISIPLSKWRKKTLGLPPLSFKGALNSMRSQQIPHLFGYSPTILPQPKDWPSYCHTTGYWVLDAPQDWQAPKDLVKFIESGPKPISIGFGSMRDNDPERITQIVLEALDMTNQRAVLISGWGKLGKTKLPDTAYQIDSVPHTWLFPRVSAVIHHGGAGTTGAGLSAGVPSILIPFGFDQFHWASRVVKLGVGPKSLPIKKLTAKSLAASIQETLTNKDMQVKAAALGSKIREEDGVAQAVRIIQSHIEKSINS